MDVATAALLAQRHISRNLVLDRFQAVFSEFESIFHEIEGEDSNLQIVYDSVNASADSESDANSRSELPLRLPFLVRPRFVKRIPGRVVENFRGCVESDVVPPAVSPPVEEDSSVPVAVSPHFAPEVSTPPQPPPLPLESPDSIPPESPASAVLPSTPPRRHSRGLSAPTKISEAQLSPSDLESRQAQAIAVRHRSPEIKRKRVVREPEPEPEPEIVGEGEAEASSSLSGLPPRPTFSPVRRRLVFDDEEKEKERETKAVGEEEEEEEGEVEVEDRDRDQEDDDDDLIESECVFVVDEGLLDLGEDAEMFSLSDPDEYDFEDDG